MIGAEVQWFSNKWSPKSEGLANSDSTEENVTFVTSHYVNVKIFVASVYCNHKLSDFGVIIGLRTKYIKGNYLKKKKRAVTLVKFR